MMAILPSILGVHIFHHQCNGCEENETFTRIITTAHSHDHACSECECDQVCTSCKEHNHHSHDEACQHQFKKASFDGKTTVAKFKFQAEVIELLDYNHLLADVVTINRIPSYIVDDAILKVPDDPSPEENCVFLL